MSSSDSSDSSLAGSAAAAGAAAGAAAAAEGAAATAKAEGSARKAFTWRRAEKCRKLHYETYRTIFNLREFPHLVQKCSEFPLTKYQTTYFH